MRISGTILVTAALLFCASAFGQSMQDPPRRGSVQLPPSPRDGVGAGGAVVPILIYHAIRPYVPTDTAGARRWIAPPGMLEAELAWLRQNSYTSVSFEELQAHLTRGAPLPPRPLIISFDDDWQNQYETAVPLLRKYGFTATFFVWVRAVGRAHHMSWDEIRELDAQGMEIGCHTMTHLRLPRLTSDAQVHFEVTAARDLIAAHLGHPVTSFAYPFGQYDVRVVQAVRDAGFTSARSTWPGVYHTRDGLLSLTGLIRTESASEMESELTREVRRAVPASPPLSPRQYLA